MISGRRRTVLRTTDVLMVVLAMMPARDYSTAASTLDGQSIGAGDTRWPLYGTLVRTWTFRQPVVFLAIPSSEVAVLAVGGLALAHGLGLGLTAVYAANLEDMSVRAVVNVYRFQSGRWKDVTRRAKAGVGTESVDDWRRHGVGGRLKAEQVDE